MESLGLLVAVVCVAYFFEVITGFGGTVIAFSILAFFFDMKFLIVYSVFPQLLVQLRVFTASWRYFDFRFLVSMLFWAFIGGAVGIFLFDVLSSFILKKILGVGIFLVALYSLFSKSGREQIGGLGRKIILFIAGVSHALIGISGPLLVVYLSTFSLKKDVFRVMLISMFFSLNIVRTVGYVSTGAFTNEIVSAWVWTLPFLTVTLVIGNKVFHRINEEAFKKVISVFLLITGVLLLR